MFPWEMDPETRSRNNQAGAKIFSESIPWVDYYDPYSGTEIKPGSYIVVESAAPKQQHGSYVVVESAAPKQQHGSYVVVESASPKQQHGSYVVESAALKQYPQQQLQQSNQQLNFENQQHDPQHLHGLYSHQEIQAQLRQPGKQQQRELYSQKLQGRHHPPGQQHHLQQPRHHQDVQTRFPEPGQHRQHQLLERQQLFQCQGHGQRVEKNPEPGAEFDFHKIQRRLERQKQPTKCYASYSEVLRRSK